MRWGGDGKYSRVPTSLLSCRIVRVPPSNTNSPGKLLQSIPKSDDSCLVVCPQTLSSNSPVCADTYYSLAVTSKSSLMMQYETFILQPEQTHTAKLKLNLKKKKMLSCDAIFYSIFHFIVRKCWPADH